MITRRALALVAEDTELGRWALTRALEAAGFDVQAVATWSEAAAWLSRASFSLAFVAVSSVSGSAADVVASMRAYHPRTRLVLLADQDRADELRLACGPEQDLLTKPLDLEKVASVAHLGLHPGGVAGRHGNP